jgi:hypothetical protein
MDSYGLKISPQKKSVLGLKNADLVFSSFYETLPVVKEGIVTASGNMGSTASLTIAHGQKFVPAVSIFYRSSIVPDKWLIYPGTGISDFTGDDTFIYVLNVDTTNISITFDFGYNGGTNPVTVDFHYFVFGIPIS